MANAAKNAMTMQNKDMQTSKIMMTIRISSKKSNEVRYRPARRSGNQNQP